MQGGCCRKLHARSKDLQGGRSGYAVRECIRILVNVCAASQHSSVALHVVMSMIQETQELSVCLQGLDWSKALAGPITAPQV
jgi:hypothetical protein